MGFLIETRTGEMGPVTLRGCSDGTVEMCRWQDIKDVKTGEVKPTLVAFKYYASIEQAFERIARMRVASFDATTLKDLVTGIKSIRSEIRHELGVA